MCTYLIKDAMSEDQTSAAARSPGLRKSFRYPAATTDVKSTVYVVINMCCKRGEARIGGISTVETLF